MTPFEPKEILPSLPEEPGVYRYFDASDTIIYIGKAKNLKNRVSSYFTNIQGHNTKTRKLVQQICRLEFTIVHSEFDALLLENTLIKQFQPKYNILLRDDKTYPFICLTKESFPRLITSRRIDHSIGTFFGPFANPKAMNGLLEMIHQLYPLRTCSLALKPGNIEQGKFKVCLEYHIGNCKGPCEAHEKEENYQKQVDAIREILKGNFKESQRDFKRLMNDFASKMQFEEAQKIKEKIDVLENYQSRSTIINPKITNIDVFSIVSDESAAFVNFLQISHGSIIRSHTLEIKKKLDESDEELLELAIIELRDRFHLLSKEIKMH